MKTILIITAAVLIMTSTSYAWTGSGFDNKTGEVVFVEVESYDHKGLGEGPVEFYDYNADEFKSGYLDMYPGGSGTIVTDDGQVLNVNMD